MGDRVPIAGADASRSSTVLHGDSTGRTIQYVFAADGKLHAASRLDHVLEDYRARFGSSPTLHPGGVWHLLGNHCIPPPTTLFRDIYALGIGGHATVGQDGTVVCGMDFPYYSTLSRNDIEFDPSTLLDKLGAAVARQAAPERESFLMLSAGKDSLSILLALEKLGWSDTVQCVTFDAGFSSDEGAIARSCAQSLGFRHHIISRPDSAEALKAYLTYVKAAPQCVTDFALIPYILAAQRYLQGANIMDGTGNDVFFGYVPSRNEILKQRLARAVPRPLKTILQNHLPASSRASFLCRSAGEITLEQREFLPPQIRALCPDATPAFDWDAWAARQDGGAAIDFRSATRGVFLDGTSYMGKVREAAAFVGGQAVFPWCDRDVISYCFHLKQAFRYDANRLINKVALRQMILDRLGVDSTTLGKRAFLFDTGTFVRNNWNAIRNEVFSCPLWSATGLRTVFTDLEGKADYKNIYILFGLSAWINRSTYAQPLRQELAAGRRA